MARAKTRIVISARDLATKPIKGVAGAIGGLGRTVGRLRFMMLGLGTALGGFGLAKEFIDANSQLEEARLRMGALLGSMKAGEQAITWIRDFQTANPVRTIQEFTESFEDLVSAGIDPTTGAMEALTAGAVKFALTADDVKGVTRALRQGLALPNFQKQELNQLAERIPGVMDKLAKELNKTVGELRKQMTLGLVDSTDVAQAVLRVLGTDSEKIIKSFGNTWQSTINRLKTAWQLLLQDIGSKGVFNDIKNVIDDFTSFVLKNTGVIRDSFVQVWGLAKGLARSIFTVGDGMDFKLKPILVMLGQIMGQTAHLFTVIKTAIKASLAGVLTLKNAFDNLNARTEAIDQGFILPGAIEREIAKLNNLKDVAEGTRKVLGRDGRNMRERVTNMGGLEGVKTRIVELYDLRRRLNKDLNDIPLEFSFTKMMDGVSTSFTEINDKVVEFIANIKKMDFKESSPKELADELDELMVALKKTTKIQNLGKTPSDADSPQGTFLTGWKEALEEVTKEFDKTYKGIDRLGKAFATGLTESLTRGFSNFFGDLIDGHIPRLKDAVNSFLKDILRMMTDVFSKKLAMGFAEGLGSMIAGNFGGGSQGLGPGTGLNSGNQGIFSGTATSGTALAKAGQSPMGGMKIEIINQTGEPAQVTRTRVKSDNGMQVLQLVLDGLQRNKGGFRDGLRGGLGIG